MSVMILQCYQADMVFDIDIGSFNKNLWKVMFTEANLQDIIVLKLDEINEEPP